MLAPSQGRASRCHRFQNDTLANRLTLSKTLTVKHDKALIDIRAVGMDIEAGGQSASETGWEFIDQRRRFRANDD